MQEKRKEREDPLTCAEFRRLVDGLSDIQAERKKLVLNRHEKQCLPCNIWLRGQLEALDDALLDAADRRCKNSGLKTVNKRISRLQSEAEARLIEPVSPQDLSDLDQDVKAG